MIKKIKVVVKIFEASVLVTAQVVMILLSLAMTGCNPFKKSSIESLFKADSVASAPSNNGLLLTVEKVYPVNGGAWLKYVTAGSGSTLFDRADVACAGSESGHINACIHGGDKLKVVVTQYSSCDNLKLVDSGSVFIWSCFAGAGQVVFYTTGFEDQKGMSDLIDFNLNDWMALSVSLSENSIVKGQSISQKWWSTVDNPISILPDSSATQQTLTGYPVGTVLILPSSQNSRGYVVDQDSLAVVVKPGSSLALSPGTSQNCNYNTGESAGPNAISLFCMGTQKYLWFEGEFNDTAHQSDPFFTMKTIKFSTLNKFLVSEGADGTVVYVSDSISNRFTNIKIQKMNGAWPIFQLTSSDYNYVYDVKISHVLVSSFTSYIEFDVNSDYNILTKATLSQHTRNTVTLNGSNNVVTDIVSISANRGLQLGGMKNTVSHVSTYLMENSGLFFAPEFMGTASAGTANQIFAINILFGLGLDSSNSGLISQNAIYTDSDYSYSLYLDNSSNNKFTNALVISDSMHPNACSVSGGVNAGVIGGTCANQGLSDALKTTFPVTTTPLPIYGAIGVNDASNLSNDSSGTSAIGAVTDFLNFENRFRAWGDSTRASGYCDGAEVCAIFDVRLKTTDSVFRNTSGDGQSQNTAYVAGATCPNAVHGSKALTDQSDLARVFLINAQEIIKDGIGNDDGLCESNEACLYSPNFGVYQGHGDYKANGTCLFQNGTVTGVTMYAYPINGI